MTRIGFRRWVWMHKWSSLLCTLFLLVSCLTGLPLVFKEEIGDLLDDGLPYASLTQDAPRASLDRLVETSRQMYPGEEILSVFVDDDEPRVIISMAASWSAYKQNLKAAHWIRFDARTGQVLKQNRPYNADGRGLILILYELHKNLFAGLSGELWMAAMAMTFIVSLISGVVVYGPFMRRLEFAEIRTSRSTRTKWLDLHNLLGIVALCWLVVVGATGVLNALSTPLFGLWQQTDVARELSTFKQQSTPSAAELNSPQAAFQLAVSTLPQMEPVSIIYPGSPFGTPFHYVVWTKGKSALTSRLFAPVLIDARTGALAKVLEMPWYLKTLEISRPLHFGDYGGMPLKVLWGLLDLVTIVILGSGLYLWVARWRSSNAFSSKTNLSTFSKARLR